MPSDLVLLSTLIGSNYPSLELIFMVPKVFEPLKFDFSIDVGTLAQFFIKVSISDLTMMSTIKINLIKNYQPTRHRILRLIKIQEKLR